MTTPTQDVHSPQKTFLLYLRTLAIAAVGGWLGQHYHLPSGWLIGSLIAVSIAAFKGIQVPLPSGSKYILGIVLGVSVGANIDPHMGARAVQWLPSYLLFALMLFLLLPAIYYYYRRGMRWPAADSLFCSVPGNLAITLTMALDTQANSQRIVLVHSIRLGFLVAIVPILVPLLGETTSFAAPQAYQLNGVTLAAFAIAGVGGFLASRIRIAAPWILGPLTTTMILKLGFAWDIHLPPFLLIIILVGLGALIGSRFNGLQIRQCLAELKAGLGGLVITLLFTIGFAGIASVLLPISFLSALLAYAPGGIEAMVFLTASLQLDPVLVASHHLMRVILMSFLVPVVLKRLSVVEETVGG